MQLTKHHGLGNDFLVTVDYERQPAVDPDLARAVCDRHRGVGADGLLHLGPGKGHADVTMVLLNADGGRAEMSGNGIGCLAQAALVWGMAEGPRVRVRTDAGLRTVEIAATESPDSHLATVAMGTVEVGGDEPEWADDRWLLRAARASVGNPHLVAHAASPDDLTRDAVEALGRRANEAIPGGINVEVFAPGDGPGELVMDVYERGVGLTLACGTGACATAAVARRWGLVGDDVVVRMPGGPTRIDLSGKDVRMTTPITYVADVDWKGAPA